MKKISRKVGRVAPETIVSKIHNMRYSDVSSGNFIKLATSTNATDLSGAEVPQDNSDNVVITTPVGKRTLDKNTYGAYNRVFSSLKTLDETVLHMVDSIANDAYSACIDLHEGTDFLTAKFEDTFTLLAGKLSTFIEKSGVEMLDICRDITNTYKPLQDYFDRLVRRIHFRSNENERKGEIFTTIPDAVYDFNKSLDGDTLRMVSVILPNAELTDGSKSEPTKKAASKNVAKKS